MNPSPSAASSLPFFRQTMRLVLHMSLLGGVNRLGDMVGPWLHAGMIKGKLILFALLLCLRSGRVLAAAQASRS